VCKYVGDKEEMVAGGKPLWYIEIFTTGATLIFTIFYASVCASWSGGLAEVLSTPERKPPDYPNWGHMLKDIKPFQKWLTSYMLWLNLATGLTVTIAGAAFAYLLLRHKIRLLYSQIWFGLVALFTLVWMVSSIMFFVKTEELAGRVDLDFSNKVPTPLPAILAWGKKRTAATVIGMIVFPTLLYLFLTFVAYRHYVKIEIYGNDDPERINRDYAPGSWVERKGAAEGGTWEREEEESDPLVKESEEIEGLRQRRSNGTTPAGTPPDGDAVQEAVLVDSLRNDSVTKGWGAWLEDVFDYTF
jgi:hypothetical protein